MLKLGRLLAVATVLVGLQACHDVLFRNAKRLPGDYELLQWEDGLSYYINAPGNDAFGCGPIEGTVRQIGWSAHYIVAKRHSCFRGDPDGWMIVDALARTVSGPHTDAELKAMDSVSDIQIFDVADAWSLLPCFTKYNLSLFRCTAPWDSVDR